LNQKWWGWGDASKSYDLQTRPRFYKFLREKLNVTGEITQQPVEMNSVRVPDTRADVALVQKIVGIFGNDNVRLDDAERFTHGFGKGYLDLIRSWKGTPSNLPDVVVYPSNESQIEHFLGEIGRAHV